MMKKELLFLMCFVVLSCVENDKKSQGIGSTTKHQPDSIAVKLNNKATRLMDAMSSDYIDSDSLLYDSALHYLNASITTDSLYVMAYINKSRLLQRKGFLESAIDNLSLAVKMDSTLAEIFMGQGFLLEKMGKREQAIPKYQLAKKAYENRLEGEPQSIKVQSDIAFLYIFLEDRNSALDAVRDLILKNPDNEELKMMEGMIKDFDKEQFIQSY